MVNLILVGVKGSGGWGTVGGFVFCDPARFMFNESARTRANTLIGGRNTGGMVVICNNNSIVHDKLLSHMRSSLGRIKVRCYVLNNMRPGPISVGMCRNVRLYQHRETSLLLTMNNNSIVSATGTVTTNIPCGNSF